MKIETEESWSTWSKYAKTYDPIKCASIDGTDCEPHDRAVVRALNSDYKPNRFVKGRPESTIFISRLNHETSKETIKELFSKYGKLRRFRMVKDIVTGIPKGYAFVEYEEEHAAEEAYRLANKMVVDGNAIFVDFECERLLKGWKPRRLGGGFAGRKESGQLRFGGRDRPFKKPIALELKEQEERRQKERRCRDDERRRRDNSRDRNRTKSPQRQNGNNSQPRDKSKPDLASKVKPKRSYSSKEKTPAKQKSNEKPSLPKTNSHLTKSGSQERYRAKKPEPTTHCSPRSSPTRIKATNEKNNIKLSSSRKQHGEPKGPSKSPSHTSRENSLPKRNRSREPRRSPIKDFGRPRSPVEHNHKRTPPRRSRRTSCSPKGRPVRKRSPLMNSGREPAGTKERLRSRSPLRKQDPGVSPLRSNRRNTRNRQESAERQANYCVEQGRDRLASENRSGQLSPRRINGRSSRSVRSPPRLLQKGFDEKRTMPREPSPSRRQARDDYSTERFAGQTNRRFPENDMMGRVSEGRLRRITSPAQEYSRRSPPEEQENPLRHVHYQEYRPYEGASHYKDHPSYSLGMNNGTEFSETHTGFIERPTNRDFHHLPLSHGITRGYATFPDNIPQFPSVGSFRDVGPLTSGHMQEQKIEPQTGRSFYEPKYDQPSRDPRQNTAQYAAHFPPQRQAIEQCSYVQNGGQHTIRRIEQVDTGSGSYNLAASTSGQVTVSREVPVHSKVDERFWRQRSRP